MTAWKQDAGKPRMDLVPHELPQGVADVLAFGAGKYGPRNWERGMDWGRVFGALQRHLWAFWGGEDRDAETGLPHTHHAACCIAFLMAYEARGIGVDDRPRRPPATLPNEGLPFAVHMARRDAERAEFELGSADDLDDLDRRRRQAGWPQVGEVWEVEGYGEVKISEVTTMGNVTAQTDNGQFVMFGGNWLVGHGSKRFQKGFDTDPQPLEWPQTPEISPPDGLGEASATHAAKSAEGPSADRVCGGCKWWRIVQGYDAGVCEAQASPVSFSGPRNTCNHWQPRIARDAWHGQDGGVE